tara:strand:+ start:264 stop:620 length:357 start_codon:yes stop_codon:yes gene_type:complete
MSEEEKTDTQRVEVLEKKYDGMRSSHFFSHCPFTICNVRQPGFPGVLLSFDLQLLIRPSEGGADPGYVTIKSVSLREYDGRKVLGLPGKKTTAGNWFSFVEMYSTIEDSIIEEAIRLL